MTVIAAVLFLCAACLHSTIALPSVFSSPFVSNIGSYTNVTLAAASNDPTHWSAWDDYVQYGNESFTQNEDDSEVQQPLDFCMPFFSRAAVQPHINSNGFLSLSPWRACNSYCGGYGFDAESPRGDWPVIGLYLLDLNPSAAKSGQTPLGRIYFRKNFSRPGLSSGQYTMTVEYARIQQYFPTNKQSDYELDTVLNAQVELFPSGTIIFRYKSVNSVRSTENTVKSSIGIHLTRNQRMAFPQEYVKMDLGTGKPNIAAIRLDPQVDVCSLHSTCDPCYNITGCAWCKSVNRCMTASIAIEVCRSADLLSGPNVTCGSTQPSPAFQSFYETGLFGPTAYVLNGSVMPPTTEIFQSLKTLNASGAFPKGKFVTIDFSVTPTQVIGYTLSFDFEFPFFEFPIREVNSNYSTRNVSLQNDGRIRFSTRNPEDVVEMKPFRSEAFKWHDSGVAVREFRLPARSPSTSATFCHTGMKGLVDAASGLCAPGVVLEVENASMAVTEGQLRMTYQILFQEDGFIAFHILSDGISGRGKYDVSSCSSDYRLYTEKLDTVLITTLEHSKMSLSSMAVPWSMHTLKSAITFTPLLGCPSCSGNGHCDPTTGTCVCNYGTSGLRCQECASGFYGPRCAKCPACQNGGTCDDGATGTGFCTCPDPFSGTVCEITCSSSDPRPLNCAGCNLVGATCLCGHCNCTTTMGWSGANCTLWEDPCRALSLKGCSECYRIRPNYPTCQWCSSTFDCAAPAQTGISNANVTLCHGVTSAATCSRWKYPAASGTALNTLLVVVAFVLLATLACVGVIALCCCRRKDPNPMVVNAVVGMADFQRPRRERELMQVQIVDRRRTGPIQGIPLKQISLRELYDHQQQVKEHEKQE